MRLNRLVGRQTILGGCFNSNEVSDDNTSMAEIVKRFFHNEPIPDDMQEKNYEYGDNVKLEDGNSFDPLTREVLAPDGSVIRVDLESPDILSQIPITPNLDMVDPLLGDNECEENISKMYAESTDRARAMVRGFKIEKSKQKAEQMKKIAEKAISSGLVETKTPVNAPQVPSNAPEVTK